MAEAGASLNNRTSKGYTALDYALSSTECRLEHLLVSLGADVDVQDSLGVTPLMRECAQGKKSGVSFLLQAG